MLWQIKSAWTGGYILLGGGKVTADDEFDWTDSATVVATSLGIADIWFPGIKFKIKTAVTPYLAPAATAVAVPVAIGGVVSYGIAGGEGVKDYYEFLTEPKDMLNKASFTYDELVTKRAGPAVWEAIEEFPSQLGNAAKKILGPILWRW